ITAIAGVCVGDIGDVITLYEMILKKRSQVTPVPAITQNECYLELCNSRLFDIDRRESRLFDFAESFAEAAHFLLVQSYKQNNTNDKKRLRQYSSIFINVSTGDIEKQNKQVRELIDAGIFNFSGGPQASRTNRQGVNPQQQFKLTYRKLYGINKHIGLAQSDRFELSGEALEEWLDNPKKGRDILIRNLKKGADEESEFDGLSSPDEAPDTTAAKSYQKSIFDDEIIINPSDDIDEREVAEQLARERTPVAEVTQVDGFRSKIIMAGLGFEDSTLASFRKLTAVNPETAVFIRFAEKGKSQEILQIADEISLTKNIINYEDAINNQEIYTDNILYDITGFPQSIIFNAIRNTLILQKEVNFAHTEAQIYYPLDEDIEKLLQKYKSQDQTLFLESLSSILSGETGPYKMVPLLPKEINPSARRVLIAFSSAKHERLYSLLDEREYDKIHILVQKGDTPRHKLAKIAAEVALRKFNHAEIDEFESENLQDTMNYLALQYQNYFVNQNFSFEIAITGSKLQTVASAAICAVFKVNQCWYLQPTKWDPNKFTKGVGETRIFKISK
ncbi:MAG TPA: hypothetical protein VNW99_05745, partial [Cytophagaceae bacterium]|nr:hypothetical protein [Cytophagaceae bacterium]